MIDKNKLKSFIGTKTAINCKTEAEADELLKVLKELNYEWYDKTENHKYSLYGNDTCYNISNPYHLMYCCTGWYEEHNFEILTISDINIPEFTKSYLIQEPKRWIVKDRDGIYDLLSDVLYLEYLNEELKDISDRNNDIMEIYDLNNPTWKREEKQAPKEITMEELTKILGYDIKIIKGECK